MNSDKSNLIGMIEPRTDVKVGDLVQVRAIEGITRKLVQPTDNVIEDHGAFAEVLVTHTIEVDSVDVINGFLWCKGPIVATDSHSGPGRVHPIFLGTV
ncbi:hypothetical protein SEA_BAJUNIPER_33 [Microbacterium phage BAjuniper]|nr:hypothetical protein SEA_BAJUNIPER_33 [Microbacterium phage BAjuniper]